MMSVLKMMIKMVVIIMRFDIYMINGWLLWWFVLFFSSVDKFGFEDKVEFILFFFIVLY